MLCLPGRNQLFHGIWLFTISKAFHVNLIQENNLNFWFHQQTSSAEFFSSFIVIAYVLIKFLPLSPHTQPAQPWSEIFGSGRCLCAQRWWQPCNATTSLLVCIYFSIKLSGLCVWWFNGKLQVPLLFHVMSRLVCLSGNDNMWELRRGGGSGMMLATDENSCIMRLHVFPSSPSSTHDMPGTRFH